MTRTQRRLEPAELACESGSSGCPGVLTARTDLYNAGIAPIAARQNRLAAYLRGDTVRLSAAIMRNTL